MTDKILKTDIEMVEIKTPLGDPALISKTSFDASKDEAQGNNFWSQTSPDQLSPTITGKIRPIGTHILIVLTPHKPKTFTFTEICALLNNAKYKHSNGMIKDNLKILVTEGKIIRVVKEEEDCFGVPSEDI